MSTDAASSSEENKKELCKKFQQLRSEALSYGLTDQQLSFVLSENNKLDLTNTITSLSNNSNKNNLKHIPAWFGRLKVKSVFCNPDNHIHLLVMALAIGIASGITSYYLLYDYVVTTPCLIDNNWFWQEVSRPLVDCDICKDIYSVPEERNISQIDFYKNYAYTGRPVLVKDAMKDWKAVSAFNFKFFQSLYREINDSASQENCQFFPYQTEFYSLEEALNMSDERASFQPGQKEWYVGWNNCNPKVVRILHEYYRRPYFLPNDTEEVEMDWIFMGGFGPGAPMHLDYLNMPSWQAQISGTKTWTLAPSPECEHVCHAFNVSVHKGDIIVLDTNIWYHSTYIHPGEISITVGSEYQ